MEDLRINFDLILNKLFRKDGLRVSVHSAIANEDAVTAQLETLVDKLAKRFRLFGEKRPDGFEYEDFAIDTAKELHLIPTNVNYCVRAFKTPPLNHVDSPKIVVASWVTR